MQLLVHRNGEQLGPFTIEEARGLVSRGHVGLDDLAWHQGLPTWVPLRTLLDSSPSTATAIQPAPPAFPARTTSPVAASTSGMAIASFVLGISTLLVCFLSGIPAVILGHLARSEIRRSQGRIDGDGMAVAGLILGYLSLVVPLILGIIFAVMLGVMGMNTQKFVEIATAKISVQQLENSARQVSIALAMYASDHGGKYPETLEELVPDYLADRALLESPLSPGEDVGYLYFGGRSNEPGHQVLMISKSADERGRRIVVRKNGTVRVEKAELPEGGPI